MRKAFLILLLMCMATWAQAPSQCRVTKTFLTTAGTPDRAATLTVYKITLSGSVFSNRAAIFRTNSSGVLLGADGSPGVNLPQGAIVWLYSAATGLAGLSDSPNIGTPYLVPTQSSANLEDLQPYSKLLKSKGDLIVAGAGGVPYRLAVGANGTVPVADSTQPLGIRWDVVAGGPGTVTSVYGRTGNVTAQANDYSFAQIGSKPTTLSGYGITDGQPLNSILTQISGNAWNGSSSLTTLGTITTGVWNGSVIGSNYGGAGTTSGIMRANGSGVVASVTVGVGLSFDGTTLSATGGGGGINGADIIAGTIAVARLPEMTGATSLVPGVSGMVPAPAAGDQAKCLSGAKTWINCGSGTGDALTSNPLSQFAATTSAQLAGVISNETGTGALVFGTAPVLLTPNLGTPSALTLTNATGLPIAGLSGLGTGIATALAVNVGSAGAPVLFNGAGGTPSSLTLTNATGLPATAISGWPANANGCLANNGSGTLSWAACSGGGGGSGTPGGSPGNLQVNNVGTFDGLSGSAFINTITASSGTQTHLTIAPTINQSGTAGFNAVDISPTLTATGSGTKNLFRVGVAGGNERLTVTSAGRFGVYDGTQTFGTQPEALLDNGSNYLAYGGQTGYGVLILQADNGANQVGLVNAGAIGNLVSNNGGLALYANLTTGSGSIDFYTGGTRIHRIHRSLWQIQTEASVNPTTTDLTAGNHVAIYRINDKICFGYNNAGTMNYACLALDGSTTAWTNSTTAP